ncbi:FlgK family flagellar hook-associated protein [Ponticoccus alexandrii]|uniref:Flagellar hook-associated protein 1 n=1 Tax=Ponticoccus alexandrii TaxID=1943633 RepID=A0ABX7FCT1_9RHOB|nr:flagellar basal body rod C-terminal domain-containing protein [Ponticoccus alexandrii]ETA52829.1 flagellar hook protein FlgK [Rhodobacteraceae bacterium PD-2]QRF68299.1 flagellar hook-associated protein FlgK [Ponticoccus alexandrii]
MSLSTALYGAFSGLKANSRAAALVSTNIANATTESYGRRELDLRSGPSGTGGGVLIDGVLRNVNPVLIADRRQSDAEMALGGTLFDFATRFETELGDSETPGSLVGRYTALENALLVAAADPSSAQRLDQVSLTADAVSTKLNALSRDVQAARLDADKEIGRQVTLLNETILRLDGINDDLTKAASANGDPAALLDEQARLLDSISEIVPLRVVQKDAGDIALYTTGGAVLLDGRPSEIGFTPVNAMDPVFTQAGGDLSGLTINGMFAKASGNGVLKGGSLAAQFEIRDEVAPARQAQLDAIARDLIERLGPGGPDATLAATDPGLFTDDGLAFVPLNETGIAGRIRINTLVGPDSGGSWRLRDGLGAATTGPVGEARLLQGISAALEAGTVPSSPALPAVNASFATHVADVTSDAAAARVRAEGQKTYLNAQNTQLKELELANGVDTDAELQRLMQIEQLYVANVKVMQTVNELMKQLMSI